jgi:glycosyltransferase involved in cell wall biosynthesis
MPGLVVKAILPTVCYLARWDRRKRPEIFLELAARFPDVRFIALGSSRDRDYERRLREKYAHLPNLEMPGHVDQFDSDAVDRILTRSWVLVNTSVREGLPNAFLEAAAHGCAILSAVDPDGFASRFGGHVQNDDFAGGLASLLTGKWAALGEQARRHVLSTFELESAVEQHLSIYRDLVPEVHRSSAGVL